MKNKSAHLRIIAFMAVCAFLAILAFFFFVNRTKAQGYYYTNNAQFGAYQYNQGYSTPLFPSKTLAAQAYTGILAGTVPLASTVTNITFGTNIYTLPPVVCANATTAGVTVAITGVTTTNVTLTSSSSSTTLNWIAVGH